MGFDVVVVRAGIHNETNQHATDGTLLTYYDERTGTKQNMTAEDDPHITVYMGYSLNRLVVVGHVYIVWDLK